MILGLAWLKKWNPLVDWDNKSCMKRRPVKQQELGKVLVTSHKPQLRKVKVEPANTLTEDITANYSKGMHDLTEVFSERESDVLPPTIPWTVPLKLCRGLNCLSQI